MPRGQRGHLRDTVVRLALDNFPLEVAPRASRQMAPEEARE